MLCATDTPTNPTILFLQYTHGLLAGSGTCIFSFFFPEFECVYAACRLYIFSCVINIMISIRDQYSFVTLIIIISVHCLIYIYKVIVSRKVQRLSNRHSCLKLYPCVCSKV